jgi:hypothetical protein
MKVNSSFATSQHPVNNNQNSEVNDVDQVCCICLEKMLVLKDKESPQAKLTLDCGHEFHRECIQNWRSVNNICPIDRGELKKIESSSLEVEQHVTSNRIPGVASDFFYPEWF